MTERSRWALTIKLLIASLFVLIGSSAFAEPVKVEGGLLQGTVEDGLRVYRGIPCADSALVPRCRRKRYLRRGKILDCSEMPNKSSFQTCRFACVSIKGMSRRFEWTIHRGTIQSVA
jgi:hypothetical protein